MVRKFLNGRFENTAFCILSPDGEERLSRTGRGPAALLGRGGGPTPPGGEARIIAELEEIAEDHRLRGKLEEAVLQDFTSFRQALNISSGDQRLLVYVDVTKEHRAAAETKLAPVFNDSDVVGRFHLDFADAAEDADWKKAVSGGSSLGDSTVFVIQPDTFGQEGKVVKKIPMSADAETMKTDLLAANAAYAKEEERKVYSEHVSQGRRQGVFFENGMPYGEDRDGDGEIDHRGGDGVKGKGKGKGKGKK